MSYEIKKVLEDGINIKIGSYASKSNAIKNCLPGYSVFDKETGEIIYTNETPAIEKHRHKKEDQQYKKMWEDLYEYLDDKINSVDISGLDQYSYGIRDGLKRVRHAMKDFEGQTLNKDNI